MSATSNALASLLTSKDWAVRPGDSIGTKGDFILVAENDVAIVFVGETDASSLRSDARQRAATIAAAMSTIGGPKAWESYLILILPDVPPEIEELVVEVQRDLTYCRKLILDARSLLAENHPIAAIERQLALLFPLVLDETVPAEKPTDLLARALINHGHSAEIVHRLVNAVDEPRFDAVEYVMSKTTIES